MLTAVVLAGPFGAAVVGAATYLLVVTSESLQVRLFNSGMAAAYGAIGGFVYLLAGGVTEVGEVQGVWPLILQVGLPLMAADIAQCLGNAVILAGIVRLSQGIPMRQFILGMLGSSGPAYIGYGIIGFLFVILWVPAGVGPASALLILAPLFVARWAFVQYGEEQRAHERTLSALVAAVETKEMYTGGHSERVASLCDLMAGSLALSHQETEALRYAGILHDVGKLAIPTRVLHPAERLPGRTCSASPRTRRVVWRWSATSTSFRAPRRRSCIIMSGWTGEGTRPVCAGRRYPCWLGSSRWRTASTP